MATSALAAPQPGVPVFEQVKVLAPAGPDASNRTELLLRAGAPYEARTVAVDRFGGLPASQQPRFPRQRTRMLRNTQ